MSSLADVVLRVRVRLQDTDAAGYVWPTTVLEEFVNEAVRRLAPVIAYHGETDVTPTGTDEEYTLTTTVGTGFMELEDVTSEYTQPNWHIYAGKLIFDSAPSNVFTIRSISRYMTVATVPDVLVDALVLYAVYRSLEWLVRRGGSALRRYLVDQGELQAAELLGLAGTYKQDFYELREEWGSSSWRIYS